MSFWRMRLWPLTIVLATLACARGATDCPASERYPASAGPGLAGLCFDAVQPMTGSPGADPSADGLGNNSAPGLPDASIAGTPSQVAPPDAGVTPRPTDAGVRPPPDAAPVTPPPDAAPVPPPPDAAPLPPPCGSLAGAAGSAVDPATSHCYVAWNTSLTRDDAESDCQTRNGTLVAITSQTENQLVAGLLGGQDRWIGLDRLGTGGSFVWLTHESVSFTDWAPGQPGSSSQLCGDFDPADGWHDRDCAQHKPYICEHAR